MIARAKTSRQKVAKKKAAKTAAAKKPAKVAARSKAKPKAGKPAPAKKVVNRRAKKTVAPVKRAAKKAGGKLAAKVAAAKPVVRQVLQVVSQALDDMKAVDVTVLDVRNRTDIADTLIVASGTSDRHVRSIAQRVVENAKKAGFRPMGVEGEREGEWILVDLQDLIIHIMLPRVREFYRLENLWDVSVAHRETVATAS